MIGTRIGEYEILAALGEGAMGRVFRARDRMLEREVALKFLHRQYTQHEEMLERFRAEARTLALLNHPNIAATYRFFEWEGDHVLVMEYVEGETLESLIRRSGPLPLPEAVALFDSVLQGIGHAHAKQVVHRDIKPSNLLRTPDGAVKITDFGIARVLGASRMTRAGKVFGTLEYMSPEQVSGGETDGRSDLYSLGIVLYELLSGHLPFEASSDYDLMQAHLKGRPTPLRQRRADLPAEVEQFIRRALEKDPGARFQSAAEMRQALARLATPAPARGSAGTRLSLPPIPDWMRKPGLVNGGVAACLVGGLGYLGFAILSPPAGHRAAPPQPSPGRVQPAPDPGGGPGGTTTTVVVPPVAEPPGPNPIQEDPVARPEPPPGGGAHTPAEAAVSMAESAQREVQDVEQQLKDLERHPPRTRDLPRIRQLILAKCASAEQKAKRAIELDPDYSKGYLYQASARRYAGRYDEANAVLRKALGKFPDDVDLKFALQVLRDTQARRRR